ncbi:ArnT family glycosyltransferase [Stigmatella erecta]|uniref:Dolichyl-phosphate-mannose-protein mannosyltransferase n=1 Tax=Stigmatella erecta TaxID=83460 RepID=A0A1I0CZL5_9BACT|nr:glycosyltransferase family 39 protein [Stigmatella erecta]SET25246.1 Dolichyl-phosphate-mannose-protein mannosyltransferase [Stigmatella erecta]
MLGRAPTREERWLACGLGLLAFVALLLAEPAVGFVRDEGIYFAAAESYAHWFRLLFHAPTTALTDAAIVRAYDINHEHPVLMKQLFGLSQLLFHETLGWLRPATALRLPALALSASVPPLLFLLGSALYGRAAGLFAALGFLLVPRHAFNAELACFDLPVVAMWLLVVYAFWRALEDVRWGFWSGLIFGLALATKHNALFLPFVLAPFALWRAWTESAQAPAAREGLGRFVGVFSATALLYGLLFVALGPEGFVRKFFLLSPHVLLFVAMGGGAAWVLLGLYRTHAPTARALLPIAAFAVAGPVLFYLHWPYLWHHPVERVAWYLAFHAHHEHYPWFYLGQLLREPPFPLAYVLVKTALTVPTSLFVPMVTGWLAVVGRALLSLPSRTRAWVQPPSLSEALVAVNAVASLLIISHPQVPHFGGVKHWIPSMAFLGLLAGAAVVRGCNALLGHLRARRPTLPAWAIQAPVFALLMLPALVGLVRVFPYGTGFYSELAGGVPGAASLGMQRQFWSSHVTGVLPWLNANAKPGARVYFHEVTGYSVRDYQRNGMLRPDLQAVWSPFEADLVAYQYHQEFRYQEFEIWQAFGTRTPVTGLYVDETPHIIVYQRPGT